VNVPLSYPVPVVVDSAEHDAAGSSDQADPRHGHPSSFGQADVRTNADVELRKNPDGVVDP